MARLACKQIDEWIVEKVFKSVEEWEKRQEQRCRDEECEWWMLCLNKLFCWLVTILVKVVRWIVETVVRLVVRIVCVVITATLEAIIDALVGLWDIVAGLFTLDFTRLWDGLVSLVSAVFGWFLDMVRVFFGGEVVAYIKEQIDDSNLRSYVGELLNGALNREDNRFTQEEVQKIKEALGVDFGVFGIRLRARAIRSYVSSDYRSQPNGLPDLIQWHRDPSTGINIMELAGYEYSEFWRRGRPQVVTVNGSVSRSDIQAYIFSNGTSGKDFSIYCITESALDTRIETASLHGRTLGLMFEWGVTEAVQVKLPRDVRHQETSAQLVSFLSRVIGRFLKNQNPALAKDDLCAVVSTGIFAYTEKLNGISAHLNDCTCLDNSPFAGDLASGVTHRDRLPDFIFKYVMIHEMGHYFGLCHADGIDRIMYSPVESSFLSWNLLPHWYLKGGPTFTYSEAQKVWNYIIGSFSASCLMRRA